MPITTESSDRPRHTRMNTWQSPYPTLDEHRFYRDSTNIDINIEALPPAEGTSKEKLFELLCAHFEGDPNQVEICTELERVYQFAHKAFVDAGKPLRHSGDETITHSLWMANLLAANGIKNLTVLSAAILHDVSEDTDVTLDDIENFTNKEVRVLVDSVTKVRLRRLKDSITIDGKIIMKPVSEKRQKHLEQEKTQEKILNAFAEDERAILIKLADSAHNMLTLQAHPDLAKRRANAQLALRLFEPLAREAFGFHTAADMIGTNALREVRDGTVSTIEKLQAEINTEEFMRQLYKLLSDWEVRGDLFGEKLALDSITVRAPSIYEAYLSRQEKKKKGEGKKYQAIDVLPKIQIFCPTEEHVLAWHQFLYRTYKQKIPTNIYDDLERMNPLHLEVPVLHPNGREYSVQIDITTSDALTTPLQLYTEASLTDNQKIIALLQLQGWIESHQQATETKEESGSVTAQTVEALGRGLVTVYDMSGKRIQLPKGATRLDAAYTISAGLGNETGGAFVITPDDEVSVSLTEEAQPGEQLKFVKTPVIFGPARHDNVTTNKAHHDIEKYLDGTEMSEKAIIEAKKRGHKLLLWFYPHLHRDGKRADLFPFRVFETVLGERYNSYGEFLLKLGMVPLTGLNENHYDDWTDQTLRKKNPIISDAYHLMRELIDFRRSRVVMHVHINDQVGILAEIGQLIESMGGSVLPFHANPDFEGPGVIEGQEPTAIEAVFMQGTPDEVWAMASGLRRSYLGIDVEIR